MIKALAKLFNLVSWSSNVPEISSEGLISPIFKKGDRFDPNNYHAICVGSDLGKLICSIINSHIATYTITMHILNKAQNVFLPKQHTSDHIYALHTLTKTSKTIKGKYCMFCRFVS